MAGEFYYDLGALYDKARDVLRAGVEGVPETTFGLEDIAPEDVWLSATQGIAGPIPVCGALVGALEGMRTRQVTVSMLGSTVIDPPRDTAVTAVEMAVARRWLTDGYDLSDEALGQIVREDVVEHGWVGQPRELLSLVVAIAATAGAVADVGSAT